MSMRRLLFSLLLVLPLPASGGDLGINAGRSAAPPIGTQSMQRTGDARTPMMIELTAEPAAVVYARERERAAGKGSAAAVEQLAIVEAQQQPMIDALRDGDIDGMFLFSIQRVGNAIAAELSAAEAARVAAMPGVRRVVPLALMRLDLSSSVSLIGAPGLWSGNSARGEGIRIGIIDTGIDYLHLDLGGSGIYSRTNFTTADVPWNAKVVGGIDLAGDDYDASSADPARLTPHPDPDPMDCDGHGTHVAGIAAGTGVRADGTAFNGPYGATIDPAMFRIGPGVAPLAQLYAIRVFGCSGITLLQAAALDWAVDPNGDGNLADHLDVVNISIGDNYGGVDDPVSMAAADNAALAGTIVVASAGNSGDTHFITSAPATAARAVSVAASLDAMDTFDAFAVTAPLSLAGTKPALPADAYDWTKMLVPVTADIAYPPSQSSGCEVFTPANAALLAGKIVLLDWTEHSCKSGVRVHNAAAANAAGVLFAYNGHARIDINIGGSAEIPAMITTQSVADAIKSALPVTIRFDAQLIGKGTDRTIDEELVDTRAEFSSRGPRAGDSLLKPDLSAPGDSIFSAKAKTGNLGVSAQGTSMSAPHVAGGMALLRQMHPDWTPEELKALAMNSATYDVSYGGPQPQPRCAPPASGAGRFSLADAAITDVLAYAVDRPGSVGISFGFVEVPGQISVERQFRIVNKSATAAVVALSYTPVIDVPGVTFDFPGGTTVSIPANDSVVGRLRLTANASAMKHRRDPASDATQGGYPRYWITEATGVIELLRGFEPLRLPVHAIVRPASSMTAVATPINLKSATGEVSIALTGNSVLTGTAYPDDWVSLFSPFELHEAHARNSAAPAALNLHYVGATSNYKAVSSSIADTMIYFGLATHGPWTSPREVYFEIRIDVNDDAKSDYVVFNTDAGTFLSQGEINDVHLAALCRVPITSGCSSQYLNGFAASDADTAVFNTDVVRYAVPASRIGLTAGHSQFRYRVYSYLGSTLIDSTGWLTFDPAHSLDLLTSLPSGMFFDRSTNPLTIKWGPGDTQSARGILLLHYFNAAGTRADVVPIVPVSSRRHSVRH